MNAFLVDSVRRRPSVSVLPVLVAIGLLVLLSIVLATPPPAAAAAPSGGAGPADDPEDCNLFQPGPSSRPGPAYPVACGALGRLVIGPPGPPNGDSTCSGPTLPEVAQRYGRPAPGNENGFGSPWIPCNFGSCLGRDDDPARPWVFIADWDDPHGWSVAALLQAASGYRADVELYRLDIERRPPFDEEGVTDLDLLDALCWVAEHVDDHPDDPPAAVNLSLGRRDFGGRDSCASAPSSLECAVRTVLDHLVRDLGIPVVAAAGNHGGSLFPGLHPSVLSAGSLNLARYLEEGRVAPSSETPESAEVLVPGYGLVLDDPDGQPWPVPAGSSFSAALASGWIAGSVTPLPAELEEGRWWPETLDTGSGVGSDAGTGRWILRHAGGDLVDQGDGGGASALVERAFEPLRLGRCPVYGPSTLRLVLGPPASLPMAPVDTADQDAGPQPGTRPCLPCYGEEPPPDPDGGEDGGISALADDELVPPTWEPDLFIDLSRSSPVPSHWRVVELRLRVGATVYTLDTAGGPSRTPDVVGFSRGLVDNVLIDGVAEVRGEGDQLSWIYVVEDATGSRWWDAVPIPVAREPGPRSCGRS